MANRELRRVQEKGRASSQKQREAAVQKRKSGKKRGEKKNLWQRTIQFLRDVRIETKKVIWPSREEVINYTIVVLITVTVITTFVLVLDFGLGRLLQLIVS